MSNAVVFYRGFDFINASVVVFDLVIRSFIFDFCCLPLEIKKHGVARLSELDVEVRHDSHQGMHLVVQLLLNLEQHLLDVSWQGLESLLFKGARYGGTGLGALTVESCGVTLLKHIDIAENFRRGMEQLREELSLISVLHLLVFSNTAKQHTCSTA